MKISEDNQLKQQNDSLDVVDISNEFDQIDQRDLFIFLSNH